MGLTICRAIESRQIVELYVVSGMTFY